jgi:hypothetical protein
MFGFVIYAASQYSRISVVLPINGSYDLIAINQDNRDIYSASDISGTWSKIISQGDYQITVRNSSESFITTAKLSGFLRETEVEALLEENKTASAIGSGPEDCLYFESVLVSYKCVGDSSSLFVHNPASENSPSFKSSVEGIDSSEGLIVDSIKSSEGTLLLIQSRENIKIAVLADSSSGLPKINNTHTLNDLNPAESYSIVKFGDGYIIHNASASKSYLYEIGGRTTPFNLIENSREDLKTVEVSSNGTELAILNTNRNEIDRTNDLSALYVVSNADEGIAEYNFNFIINDLSWCGQDAVCAIRDDSLMYIVLGQNGSYDIKSRLSNVSKYAVDEYTSRVLAIVEDKQVFDFDFSLNKGQILIETRSYSPSSIAFSANNNPLVSISGRSSDTTILFGDETRSESSNIENVLESFENAPFINSVSVYGNRIFVSPEVGDIEFIESTQTYDFNPQIVADVSQKIVELTNTSGANDNGYIVINVLSF